jgi:hypothetical protein
MGGGGCLLLLHGFSTVNALLCYPEILFELSAEADCRLAVTWQGLQVVLWVRECHTRGAVCVLSTCKLDCMYSSGGPLIFRTSGITEGACPFDSVGRKSAETHCVRVCEAYIGKPFGTYTSKPRSHAFIYPFKAASIRLIGRPLLQKAERTIKGRPLILAVHG